MRCASFSFYAGLVLFAISSLHAQQRRPAITGISHMCVLAHDQAASTDFYGRILGATKAPDPQDSAGTRFYFSPTQFVEVLPLPANHSGLSRISCVAFNTDDSSALRSYLIAHGVSSASPLKTAKDGTHWFVATDPEGNQVQFLQPGRTTVSIDTQRSISSHVIHVGYMVKSRADEDHFYKDILGFRPYWFGAREPNRIDWISQQVPDGHDWIEYMMVGDASDTPMDHVDARNLVS
jgi:catechol 2,3-dioxygenase-like lactoylglutathione lyase family enzyme